MTIDSGFPTLNLDVGCSCTLLCPRIFYSDGIEDPIEGIRLPRHLQMGVRGEGGITAKFTDLSLLSLCAFAWIFAELVTGQAAIELLVRWLYLYLLHYKVCRSLVSL